MPEKIAIPVDQNSGFKTNIDLCHFLTKRGVLVWIPADRWRLTEAGGIIMRRKLVCFVASAALLIGHSPPPVHAQTSTAVTSNTSDAENAERFSTEQLDALLAPIALYPDVLLTQTLMATTNPTEVVAAGRWLAQGTNKNLRGAALEQALASQPWDPAVKSLVPFPQVLDLLGQHLDWTEQLGYAMQAQQPEVFESVQRLRLQAQAAGQLKTTPEQVVRVEPPPQGAPHQIIVIEPAKPEVVYVPVYNPAVVYGAWPYPAIPPVYYPPPPGYVVGSALVAGLAFGAGIAITAGLWGWARPNWGCCWSGGYVNHRGWGNVNVNINHYNKITVNRPWQGGPNGQWRPSNPNYRPGGGSNRPVGPVGRPGVPSQLPAGVTGPRGGAAVVGPRGGSVTTGRPSVSVPGNVVRPPDRPAQAPAARPGGNIQPSQGQITRPSGGAQQPGGSRPSGGSQAPAGGRPGGGAATQPTRPQAPAFSGVNEGRRAQEFGNRGAQSRQSGGGAVAGGRRR